MSMGAEYEFNAPQSDVIRSLARKLGAVGLLVLLFGLLNLVQGAFSAYVGYKDPDKVLEVIKQHVPADKLDQIKVALGSGKMSPFVISGIAVALGGLIMVLFGFWSQQAAGSFKAVADTRGQDITRLMEALGSLNKAYGLIYNLMLLACVMFVASLVMSYFTNR